MGSYAPGDVSFGDQSSAEMACGEPSSRGDVTSMSKGVVRRESFPVILWETCPDTVFCSFFVAYILC